ncbi:HAMP domain-containing histidine kinase [Paenibacillus sp. TRM 82003]|uniref:sensor histidine kinase n=1 Tax=Kineococcus sp. TRM81007 TaxID=2925831 RepID=UPI001F57D630|nr:HAMP domain-containing sensor histidine kinase [Kineococcus sp. TRM81007]MCI2239919.1 HAMP domain-containing histidine kinase [Kineococcus sp. TRM81007]MCI3925776.1 HAMP domain-containing histidine kinase [Paenibacillus sp. TRM 82003]
MSRAGAVPGRWRGRVRAAEERVPLQTRLLVIAVALLLVAMTVFGGVSLTLLRSNLLRQVDEELNGRGRVAVEVSLSHLAQGYPSDAVPFSSFYVLLTDADGGSLDELCPPADGSRGCTARPDLPELTSEVVAERAGTAFTVGGEDDGGQWRVLLVTFDTVPVNAAVALPLAGVQETLARYRTVALLAGASVLLLGTGLAAVVIRRSFRPLDDIERTASAIAAGDLSRRVRSAPPTTEIGRLAAALNAMLARIEDSFRARQRSEEQMRRFVADASHELRTPLAAIRGFAELYRQGAVREPQDVVHVMGRIEGESTRLGRLVEDLLALARLDEAQRRPDRRSDPVDLVVVASDAVHDARALAPDRQVRLTGVQEGTGPASAVVLADEAGVRQVVTNLLGNALHHTPAGTPVEVAVGLVAGPSGPESVLEVRDHGPGLPPEEAERVFERFYRLDASRRRGTGGGSGLGLAIVASIVAGHGGTVAAVPTPGGGATFRVRFRAAPAQLGGEDGGGSHGDGGGPGGGERVGSRIHS